MAYPPYPWSSYLSYAQMREAWLDLENLYPDYVTHEVLGQTWQGKDILLFKIGNPNGGRVWFNGTIHGGEIVGTEVYYKYARWLLDNMEPGITDRIMSRNYTLIVPFMNADGYPTTAPVQYVNEGHRTNRNPTLIGINLNRNSPRTWKTGCGHYDASVGHRVGEALNGDGTCTSPLLKMPSSGRPTMQGYCYVSGCNSGAWTDIPGDWEFRGNYPSEGAGSEPETVAILNGLAKWMPRFFLDYHIWAGPYIYRSGITASADLAYHQSVISKATTLATQRGVSGYSYTSGSVAGQLLDSAYANTKATSYGIESLSVTHIPGDYVCSKPGYTDQASCVAAGGTWKLTDHYDMLGPYTDVTNNAYPRFLPLAITFSQECEVIPSNCETHTTQTECEAAGCYWYNGSCHGTPPPSDNSALLVIVAAAVLLMMLI